MHFWSVSIPLGKTEQRQESLSLVRYFIATGCQKQLHRSDLDFQHHVSWSFLWSMVVHCVVIGGIIDYHCSNFLFTKVPENCKK
jgi:hypothetical protein